LSVVAASTVNPTFWPRASSMPNHSGRLDPYRNGTARYTFGTPPSGSNTPPIDSAGLERCGLPNVLQRGLVVHNEHHLLVTTRAFLEFAVLRDLADLPPLLDADDEDGRVLGIDSRWEPTGSDVHVPDHRIVCS
jgi:hypothetical protein